MPDKPAAPPNISLATAEHVAGITPTDAVKMQLEAQKHRRVADPLDVEAVLGDAYVTAQNDAEQAAAAVARMERLSRLSATDAVRMQQRAAEKKDHAADRTAHGDRIGARFDLAEADALERDALDVLDPLTHTTAPVQVGRGGELGTGAAMMTPYVDTVRAHPDWLAHDASRERMDLADKANALTMGLDAAETIQASNSLEKMLVHELAAAHALGMRMAAAAGESLAAYKNNGCRYPHLSIESCRMANTAARLMDAYQRGLLTLERMRNGGRQVVTVQHVNISVGQAVVAGSVGGRNPGDGQE